MGVLHWRIERVIADVLAAPLRPGQVGKAPKPFDLVSPDGDAIGDAKDYALVGGQRLPPARFSTIVEHVWLLEKTPAGCKFLAFGNAIDVPRRWLAGYGHLRGEAAFYFLADEGEVITLDGTQLSACRKLYTLLDKIEYSLRSDRILSGG